MEGRKFAIVGEDKARPVVPDELEKNKLYWLMYNHNGRTIIELCKIMLVEDFSKPPDYNSIKRYDIQNIESAEQNLCVRHSDIIKAQEVVNPFI